MPKADVFRASGDLTHHEVPALYRKTLSWRAGGLPDVIDLADVRRCDSSALALLLEWLSWARAGTRPLRFENPPRNLLTLARISEADALLGFAQAYEQETEHA